MHFNLGASFMSCIKTRSVSFKIMHQLDFRVAMWLACASVLKFTLKHVTPTFNKGREAGGCAVYVLSHRYGISAKGLLGCVTGDHGTVTDSVGVLMPRY